MIKLDPTKLVSVIFGRAGTNNVPPLQIENQTIHLSKHATYLGVTTGRKLNVNKHITNITRGTHT